MEKNSLHILVVDDDDGIRNLLKDYLSKITDDVLYAYNVYQIESEGRNLFLSIEGNEDTIMGLPVQKIKEYIGSLK